MRLAKPWLMWTARPGGGLCFGLRIHFPVSISDMEKSIRFKLISVHVGLGPVTVVFGIKYQIEEQ